MEEVIKYKNDEDLCAEFILNNEIGYGSYGKVYMCHLKWCDEKLNFPSTLACKVCDKGEIDEYIIQREKELCMSSEGKNLIKIYCVLQNKSCVYFFFHFYNGGTLKELIKLKDKLDEKLVARIIEQILKGLIELHNKGIIHRDLKPDNILLHFECMNPNQKVNKQFIKEWSFEKHCVFSVIIADLGCGREISLEMSKGIGTALYRAPEVTGISDLNNAKYDSTADILSLGIILHELLFGEPLFTGLQARSYEGLAQLWEIGEEYYRSDSKQRLISLEAMQFLQYCLQKDSKRRLSADELYELDFIQKAYNDEDYTYSSEDMEYTLSLTSYSDFYEMK